jgi:hypothetical protein
MQAHCLRLPGTLLARVLLHVPQQQRLQHAAPVCSSFATAAAAATVSVDIDSLQTKQLPAFQAWIDRHAQQLVSISVKTPDWDADQPWLSALQLRLPAAGLQQLCSLDLAGVEVLLPERTEANSSSSGNTSTSTNKSLRLPKLQDLRLDSCVVRVATVRQLGQLSGLTRLQLRSLSQDRVMLQVLELRPFGSLQHQLDITTAVRQILQRSPQLARLELACWNMLYVTASKMLSGFAAHFPSSLTALRVGDLDVGMEAPDLTGSISALTSLRELAAARVSVCPSALTSLTQLRDLQLHYFTFPPPESDNPAGAADGGSASALLSALSGMLQLQRLSVINEQNALAGANASQFSALTASSQLTHLQVTAREQQPLPSAALQHMFPGGKQLPLLQHVALSTYGPGAEPGNLTVAVTAEELSSMFSACPGLCSLNITGFLYPDTAYDALLELPSTCCSLCIGGEDLDDEAAGVIAQLTHLTCLDWTNSPDLTDAGVSRAVTASQQCCCVLLLYLLLYLAQGQSSFAIDAVADALPASRMHAWMSHSCGRHAADCSVCGVAGVECLTALQELQSLCLSRNYGLSAGLLQGRAGVYLKVSEPDAGAQVRPAQLALLPAHCAPAFPA